MTKSEPMNDAYTRSFRVVKLEEQALVKERRHGRKSARYVGLALSGGGIRSASFALGVLQALEKHGVFSAVDYLSTVSGGGYIGSSLTWFTRKRDDGREAGKAETSFPLGAKGHGTRSRHSRTGDAKEDKENLALGASSPDTRSKAFSNSVLGYLRQHGNYLTPDRRGVFALIALMVRSTFLSLLVYASLLTSLFLFIHWVESKTPLSWTRYVLFDVGLAQVNGLMLLSAGALLAFSLIGAIAYSLSSFRLAWGQAKLDGESEFRKASYRFRWNYRKHGGRLWTAIFLLAVVGTVPFASAFLQTWPGADGWVAGISTLAGAFAGVAAFVSDLRGGKDNAGRGGLSATLTSLWLPVAGVLLLYGLLLLGHTLATQASDWGWWQLAPLAVAIVIGATTTLNYLGVTRMYRDRLMELFLPEDDVVVKNGWWEPASGAETFNLWKAASKDVQAPYHILNATITTLDDEDSKYRGRNGDSFILAPLYCGSNATGWRRTGPKDEKDRLAILADAGATKPKDLWMNGGLTLASALAISGAAVNPNSGVRKGDLTRRRAVSMVMAVLNLRLGYWAHNPKHSPRCRNYPASLLWPGAKQLLRRGIDSNGGYVELTDGGHFENLGLYELIRRRMDTIIVSDASADPGFSFASLANALEKIRVDFGVTVDFSETARLEWLLPNSGGDDTAAEKYDLSKNGFAIGTIKYPEAAAVETDGGDADQINDDGGTPRQDDDCAKKVGIFIYLKPTLIRDLPADIFGYKDAHSSYPHQTTADQFFDEEQFEAYRELGYRLADVACEEDTNHWRAGCK